MLKLGGAIAGLKAQATTTFEFCAREASQIFGGLSYSRGGQGAKVERLYRDVRGKAPLESFLRQIQELTHKFSFRDSRRF